MVSIRDLFNKKEESKKDDISVNVNMQKLNPEEKVLLLSMLDSKKKRDDNKLVEVE